MAFRLDLRQISFNLVKNALASRQLGFLATSIAFRDILTGMCRNQNFEQESDLHLKAFQFLEFFSPFLFAAVIDLLLGLLAVKTL